MDSLESTNHPHVSTMKIFKTSFLPVVMAFLWLASSTFAADPTPAVITPGTSGSAPSDAIVLFDGKDLSAWKTGEGGAPKWKVENGYAEVNSGGIMTREEFGPLQLHVEW